MSGSGPNSTLSSEYMSISPEPWVMTPALLGHRAADLDAQGAGQDRVVRQEQRVRAGGQARHALRYRDLLADPGHRAAGIVDRPITVLISRTHGVALIPGVAEAVGLAGSRVDKRRGHHIDGAALA